MADLVDAGPDLDLPALELDAAAGRAQAQQRALSELRSTGLLGVLLENPAADDAGPNGGRYLAGQVQRVLGVSLVVETRAASAPERPDVWPRWWSTRHPGHRSGCTPAHARAGRYQPS